ncbi:hypothetical protein [Streptomyces sp. Ru73]|uniref:hypothetical protein n=1 Tax=Streptomyces sp. Ru73 TaxID=2080748 RepID=UPI0015E4291C|nr:hypothetical protein [Streptomyces sp. Ru73]
MRKLVATVLATLTLAAAALVGSAAVATAADPQPSWNNANAHAAIAGSGGVL